jgi:ribosomal protein S18 acetylase RimI-like enzyme
VREENRPNGFTIKQYTENELSDVLEFETRLRDEEDVWGWDIDQNYVDSVAASFADARFSNALSLLAYEDSRVIGRIDAVLIPSHFDGSVKAYLDWICVLKSCRHRGAAQKLMAALREELARRGVDTLIALTASNEEAQSFYKSVPDSVMRDVGIWIDVK